MPLFSSFWKFEFKFKLKFTKSSLHISSRNSDFCHCCFNKFVIVVNYSSFWKIFCKLVCCTMCLIYVKVINIIQKCRQVKPVNFLLWCSQFQVILHFQLSQYLLLNSVFQNFINFLSPLRLFPYFSLSFIHHCRVM